MNLLNEKRDLAIRALATLDESLVAEYNIFVRDSAIQRFEYTTEAVWKYLQFYLKELEGIVCNSPKSCMREAKKAGILNDVEAESSLEMIDDRNLTSHTYHEKIANMLFAKLPVYSSLMRKMLDSMNTTQSN